MALGKNGIDYKAIERDQKAIDRLPNRGRARTNALNNAKDEKRAVRQRVKIFEKNKKNDSLAHLFNEKTGRYDLKMHTKKI